MKVAISLPDELFSGADRLARRLRKTRSELYRDALREYIERHDADAVTEALDRVASEVDDRDASWSAVAARVLGRSRA